MEVQNTVVNLNAFEEVKNKNKTKFIFGETLLSNL